MKKDRKKIFLDSQDDVSLAVKKFTRLKETEAVLNIPRNSKISTLDDFQYLRQKAKEVEKRLYVESIDDHILEVSELAGLRAVNPVFKTRGRPVTDILPVRINRPRAQTAVLKDEDDEDLEDDIVFQPTSLKKNKDDEPVISEVRHRKLATSSGKGVVFIRFGFLISLIGLGYWTAFYALPKVMVAVELTKYTNAFADQVRASINVPAVKTGGGVILMPAETLRSLKNMEMSFPAANKADVKRPAEGKLTVFNAYSSTPQSLVAKTRFETPDGKVFRLKETVKIPGAEIVDSKIKPASVEVEVVADEPGAGYNIGPVDKWTIPGFKGTPKFEGFYAKSDGLMRGGVIGYQAAPTEEEIVNAKKKIKEALVEALRGETKVLMTDNFEVLDGTTAFKVNKEEIYPTPESETNFSVFMEAEMKQLVFEKDMLSGALIDKNKEIFADEEIDFRVRNFVFQYDGVNANVADGEVSFLAKGSVVFERNLDVAGLAASLVGGDLKTIRDKANALKGVQAVKVKFWPFWVRKAPSGVSKVKVTVE